MKKTILTISALIVAAGILVAAPSAMGGNKEMVEKRVREMDLINRDVVYRISDLPSDGRVHVKAKITYPDGKKQITILKKEIIPIQAASPITTRSTTSDEHREIFPTRASEPSKTKEEEIDFNNNKQQISTDRW